MILMTREIDRLHVAGVNCVKNRCKKNIIQNSASILCQNIVCNTPIDLIRSLDAILQSMYTNYCPFI